MSSGRQCTPVSSLRSTETATLTSGTSIRIQRVLSPTRRPSSRLAAPVRTRTSTTRRRSAASSGRETAAESPSVTPTASSAFGRPTRSSTCLSSQTSTRSKSSSRTTLRSSKSARSEGHILLDSPSHNWRVPFGRTRFTENWKPDLTNAKKMRWNKNVE